MSDIDHERVASLLSIAKDSGEHSGKLSSLQGWAIRELIAINDEIKAAAVAQKKADDELEAQDREGIEATQPRAIPSQQFHANGEPVEAPPAVVDRRI